MTLKQIVEDLVADKSSDLHKFPEGVKDNEGNIISYEIYGKDYQQDVILKIVSKFESEAYDLMVSEYPTILEAAKMKRTNLKNIFQESKKDYLEGLVE